MSKNLTLVSAISLAVAIPALGLSINTALKVSELKGAASVSSDKAAEVRDELNGKYDALVQSFETRVEKSLESIIERRRTEASANAAKRPSSTGEKIDSSLSLNDAGQVVYGNPDAGISVITFKDFRCSFCEKYHGTIKSYIDQSGGKVNWIYKPYPVLGPASDQLAQAGECVAQLEGADAFWRFADQAYASKNWNAAVRYSELKAPEKVAECVKNGDFKERVDASIADGRQLNITGTPASVFRNNATKSGALIPGFLQPDQIDQMVKGVMND